MITEQDMINGLIQVLKDLDKNDFVDVYNSWCETDYTIEDVDWDS
jgi:hypothetical protein